MSIPTLEENPVNEDRLVFCEKYDLMKGLTFCLDDNKYQYLYSPENDDDDSEIMPVNDRISSVPWIVTPVAILDDNNMEQLTATLYSITYQMHVITSNVYLLYNTTSTIIKELAVLFGFNSINITSRVKYPFCNSDFQSVVIARQLFTANKYVIIIKSGLILYPDYTTYINHVFPVLEKDNSISAISGWNPNGFDKTSGNPSRLYRIEDFPGLGFLIRNDICLWKCSDDAVVNCTLESVLNWWKRGDGQKSSRIHHTVVPDVSRVAWHPTLEITSHKQDDYLYGLFNSEQRANRTYTNFTLESAENVADWNYDVMIRRNLDTSILIRFTDEEIDNCERGIDSFATKLLRRYKRSIYTVYYVERDIYQQTTLKQILRCLNFYQHPRYPPLGLYRGIIRYYGNDGGNDIYIMKQSSPFYNYKDST